MDVNQPDGGILVLQKRKYPIVQQIKETGSPDSSFSREIPAAPEELFVYRSIRQLESPGRE
jgi:hypothetical protein